MVKILLTSWLNLANHYIKKDYLEQQNFQGEDLKTFNNPEPFLLGQKCEAGQLM